ncbi:MAG: hypothetical protein ACREBB_10865 [Nitrosotalea sp.]
MAKLFHEMRAGNQNRSINVDIGHGVILKGRVELTTKGNGGLSIANLDLRTYDTHNDGLVYKTKMLDTDLVDLSGNGYLDIVVSGIAVHTLTIPYKEEDIIFIYRYIPDKKIFEQIYRKSSFEIDVDKMP